MPPPGLAKAVPSCLSVENRAILSHENETNRDTSEVWLPREL